MHDGARRGIKNVRILRAIHAPASPCGNPSVPRTTEKAREGCSHSLVRRMHRKASRAHRERRTGETYAFTLDSDRARVSKLYSLFHAGKPRERWDQSYPAGSTGTTREKGGKRKRKERKIVKRYLSYKLREKSMSTAVNYDKCRECDAAISRYHQRRAAKRATFNPPLPFPISYGTHAIHTKACQLRIFLGR